MSLEAAAVLSGGLLVRKGAAIPTRLGPTSLEPTNAGPINLDSINLGPTGLAALSIRPRAVPDGAVRMAIGGAPPSGRPRHANRTPRSTKVSLRLDAERHRKLRLAAIHLRRSGQRILLDALDAHLARCVEAMPAGDCACLQRKPSRAT
jgi:hypothetical protein